MTNREWLNSLSDEELADKIRYMGCLACPCFKDCGDKSCNETLTDWLKSERSESK